MISQAICQACSSSVTWHVCLLACLFTPYIIVQFYSPCCYCLAVLVIFSVVVSFNYHCPVLLTVLLEIIMVIDSFLKNSNDLHVIQTLKYEIRNIVISISNKNYYVAFNSTFCRFLTFVLTGIYMSYLQTAYP